MAAVAGPRQMFKEILMLIAGCGHHPHRHDPESGQMQQNDDGSGAP